LFELAEELILKHDTLSSKSSRWTDQDTNWHRAFATEDGDLDSYAHERDDHDALIVSHQESIDLIPPQAEILSTAAYQATILRNLLKSLPQSLARPKLQVVEEMTDRIVGLHGATDGAIDGARLRTVTKSLVAFGKFEISTEGKSTANAKSEQSEGEDLGLDDEIPF